MSKDMLYDLSAVDSQRREEIFQVFQTGLLIIGSDITSGISAFLVDVDSGRVEHKCLRGRVDVDKSSLGARYEVEETFTCQKAIQIDINFKPFEAMVGQHYESVVLF
jgi:hypothetical protein